MNREFLLAYLSLAPCPLAFERTLECRIYSRQRFERPVLDLGCGDGIFAKVLFAEPVDTGVDLNPRELEGTRRLGVYHELIQCAGDRLPKPDGSYNTIVSNSVLEHIPDLPPVLREMHRVLAPGGTFYATVPSRRFEEYSVLNQFLTTLGLHGFAARYRRFFNRFWQHYHVHSREECVRLFEQHGFRVIESHEYGPKSVCLLNDFLVPFSLMSFVSKRLTNRWTSFPRVRRAVFLPLTRAFQRILQDGERTTDGGLVFLAAMKGE
jgi:SAM-dependent methyltransferase